MFLLREQKQNAAIGTIFTDSILLRKNVKYSIDFRVEQKTDYENWF
jgi:hypothetical protein